MALVCESLTCKRGGRTVFSGLGFCLPPGGFLLAKGGNGSGKTTLIQTLAGIKAPAEGRITWNEMPIARNKPFRTALTYIGGDGGLRSWQTVEQNLRRFARARNAEAMLPGALQYFDLKDKLGIRVKHLSAGWRQRVALAKLLLSPGTLWLLDEPTNFLDPEAIELLAGLIEIRVKHDGMVIVASHTMNSALPPHVMQIEDFA